MPNKLSMNLCKLSKNNDKISIWLMIGCKNIVLHRCIDFHQCWESKMRRYRNSYKMILFHSLHQHNLVDMKTGNMSKV